MIRIAYGVGTVGVMGVAAGDEAFCCLPLINFSYSFGR